MKNLIIKLVIVPILFGLTACNKDFLDRPDLDSISTESFWQTPGDLELYVTQFYATLPSWSPGAWNGGIYWADGSSDNLIHFNVNNRLAGLNTINSGTGNWDYGNIRSVNIFLSKYEEVDAPFEEISHSVGEAYFFRAFFYFNLLKNYGGVPWVSKPLEPGSEELFKAKDSRDVIATNILADLDKAIEYLHSGEQSNGNRMNKEVAMLMKSRVALYEGTWEKYHSGTPFGVNGSDGTQFLEIAASAAENLMGNSGGYGIHSTGNPDTDYWLLFNQTELNGHSEVMLWRDFDISQGITHNGQRYLPRIGGGYGLTKQLIDDYLCTDGKPIAESEMYMGDDNLLTVATNRDPRLSQTVFLPGDPMEMVGEEIIRAFEKAPIDASGASQCPTGYMIFKGANPDPTQYATSGVGTTTSPTFRFAEALLNFAEAKAELGTITQDDLDQSINLLRSRVEMPPMELNNITTDPNWLYPDLSPVINEVRRERHVEFAIEGYRFDDLMRWRAHEVFVGQRLKGAKFIPEDFPDLQIGVEVFLDADGYLDPLVNQIPDGYRFDPNRDYLLTIPIEQITLNSNLEQNPGWN